MSKVRVWFRRPDPANPEEMINASFVTDGTIEQFTIHVLGGGILTNVEGRPRMLVPAHQITLIEEFGEESSRTDETS